MSLLFPRVSAYRLYGFHRPLTKRDCSNLTLNELAVALCAKPPMSNIWQLDASRKSVLLNLSPKLHKKSSSGMLWMEMLHHSVKYRSPSKATIPVFSIDRLSSTFRYVGPLYEIGDPKARQEIIRGNYGHFPCLIDAKDDQNKTVKVDAIIAGNQETLKDPYALDNLAASLISCLVADVARLVLKRGISADSTYANTLVYQFNREPNVLADPKLMFEPLGKLANLPASAEEFILTKNFTVVETTSPFTPPFLILGIDDLDPRDFNRLSLLMGTQSLKWTKQTREFNKSSKKKITSLMPSSCIPKLGISRHEITQALHVSDKTGDWSYANRFETLAFLPSEKATLAADTYKDEEKKMQIMDQGEYLIEAIERHQAFHSTTLLKDIPVFSAKKEEKSEDYRFRYDGSLSKLSSEMARQMILKGQYGYYHSALDIQNGGHNQLDVIITCDLVRPTKDMYHMLINKIVNEKIKQAVHGNLKMGELYSDIPVFMCSASSGGKLYRHVEDLGEISEATKLTLEKKDYAIEPHAFLHSSKLTGNRLKSATAIVLGTKEVNWSGFFSQDQLGY